MVYYLKSFNLSMKTLFFILILNTFLFSKTFYAEKFHVIPDDGNDDSVAINRIIDEMGKGDILILPNGTLDIKNSISIHKNYITIEGKEKTTLFLHLKPHKEIGIKIVGERNDKKLKNLMIKRDKEKGANFVSSIDGYYYLCIENNPFFLNELGSKKWNQTNPCLRSDILDIDKGVFSDTISFDTKKTNEDFYLQEIFPVKNVILKNLIIESNMTDTHNREYENFYPDLKYSPLFLKYAKNIALKNIKIINAPSNPLELEYVTDSIFSDIYIDGSLNKGVDGHGYLRVSKSHRNLFENLEVYNIRHITFQWSSSKNIMKNVITNVDVNFHGGYERDNSVLDIIYKDIDSHKWKKVTQTPNDAHWAPPSGNNNNVKEKGK